MSYKVVLTTEARNDEQEAYNYYEDLRVGLGEELLHILAEHYESLEANPLLYSYTDERKVLRDLQILRFPYVVIFEVVGFTVVVYAVHNTHRQIRF